MSAAMTSREDNTVVKGNFLVRGSLAGPEHAREDGETRRIVLIWNYADNVVRARKVYKLRVNSVLIELASTMFLHPCLELFETICHEAKTTKLGDTSNFVVSISTLEENSVEISFNDLKSFRKWHTILCKTFEEITVTEACEVGRDGCLSVRKMERAVKRCELYVPLTNHYVSRAVRLLARKKHLSQVLKALKADSRSESRESLLHIVSECSRDRILAIDNELRYINVCAFNVLWHIRTQVCTRYS